MATKATGVVYTVLLIALWYAANIGVLLMNKYLLSSTGFSYPVFVTLCHQTACLVLGAAVHFSGWIPAKPIKSRAQFSKVVILAIIFCLAIVLGNVSLQYLAVRAGEPNLATPSSTASGAFASCWMVDCC